MPERENSFARRPAFIVASLAALALGVRLVALPGQGLWLDESYSVVLATSPASRIIAETELDNHPPLYYLLLHYWAGLAGASVISFRLLSVLFGVATVALGTALARRIAGDRAAVAAGLLLGLSPFLVYYSHEIRQYALLGLECLIATYGLALLCRPAGSGGGVTGSPESGSRPYRDAQMRGAMLLGLGSAAALYTMYVGGLVFGAQVLAAGLVLLRQPRDAARRGLAWLGLATAAVVIAFLPWAPVALRQARHLGAILEPQNAVLKLAATVLVWLGGYTQTRHAFFARDRGSLLFLAAAGILAAGLLLITAVAALRRDNRGWAILLLIPTFLPPALLWLISLRKPMYLTYCLLPCGVLFLLAGGIALATARGRRPALAAWSVFALAGLAMYWSAPTFGRGQTMLNLATWLQAASKPSDTVLFENEWLYLPAEAYARLGHRRLTGGPMLLTAPRVAPTSPLWPPIVPADGLRASLGRLRGRVILVSRAGPNDLRAELVSTLGRPVREITFPGSHQNPPVTAAVFAASAKVKPGG